MGLSSVRCGLIASRPTEPGNCPYRRSEVAVHGAAMGDAQCDHDEFSVLDGVNDAVVADPDAPQAREADERPSVARPRVDLQRIDGLDDTARKLACRAWSAP